MSALAQDFKEKKILPKDIFSIAYHDKFDYPLNRKDLERWKLGNYLIFSSDAEVQHKEGHFFIAGKKQTIIKRLLREKISQKKMKIAKIAANLLSSIPSIKFVGVTGSLAMLNADMESDIDLIIVTSKDTLWTTRLLAYLLFVFKKIRVRKARSGIEKDMLCLNMWLDTSSLAWKKRNIYTAHEIAQIVPLLNRDKIFEKFLEKNKWIKQYWPNGIKAEYKLSQTKNKKSFFTSLFIISATLVDPLAYKIQRFYMKSKITRERVSRNMAIFHPVDWSKFLINRLTS